MIRVILPPHLRTLAGVGGAEVELDVAETAVDFGFGIWDFLICRPRLPRR